ncbi:zinc-dependent alcohol dehydrogenase [Blastococcus saxobsidens]|uniref:Alcohol dehydrogenase zinc-binding domain protein n=1 Tax=Blastococcus saxobsidens (strain DD2) TaxID=1146883 RepID=H6RWY7_BLASD|nr:zinc-binding dehydrogenase [Blastococcus saxobsidens]CCG03395.1 Alcohol dehydrogenase zinc-binding domain protein [Blastococcus saxobsidens DD2]
MKAVQFQDVDKLALAETDTPSISEDEVLVTSRAVGICHSDFELLEGRYIIPFDYPIVPGHEWAGEIVEVGRAVTDFKPGDRVVGECVIGEDHFGFSISGAAAEYFVARPEWLHRVPEELTDTQAALVEPFSCAYFAAMRADNLNASDTAVVFGAGPIGLSCVAVASALGARVIVAEPNASRADLARRLGADEVVDPTADGFLDAMQELTRGQGADVVLEASGQPAAMAATLEVAGLNARLVNIGIDVGRSAPAQLGLIQSKQLQIRGSIGSPGVWPQTLRFLARTGIDLSPMVTRRFGLDEAPDAYAAARQTGENIKVHIENRSQR